MDYAALDLDGSGPLQVGSRLMGVFWSVIEPVEYVPF
jgi:hypothetical protein